MAERRIGLPEKQLEFSKRLKWDGENDGVFETWVDLLVFAASYGYVKGRSIPVDTFAKQPDPIRKEVFENHGYDAVINLIAVSATDDLECLSTTEDAENERARIFEEFANGGLEELQRELFGAGSYSDMLLHLVHEASQVGTEDDQVRTWVNDVLDT